MTIEFCAVILAGGIGKRLHPLTSILPKPLVKVTNKPMIDYAINHVKYAGIKHIIIALAHRGNLLKEYLEKEWTQDKLGDIRLEYLIQDSIGTADAVKKCRENIDSEKFIVSMGDIVTNLPMKNIMQFHSEKKGISTISMKTVESHTSQYGVVLLDKNRKIYLFLEKPLPMELYVSGMAQRTDLFLHTNIINTGIYAFDTKILDILESQPLVDFGGDVFPYLLANNYDLYGFVENYYWLDVGNPQTYLWANWDLLRKYGWPITPNGDEDDNIWTINKINTEGSVNIQKMTCFGDDVRLKNNVQIKELSVIGSNVEIKEDSIIDKSVIWDNVSIGAGCKVDSSIICNDCSIGNNVVLNNVIIGPNCKISDDKVISDKSIEMGTEI